MLYIKNIPNIFRYAESLFHMRMNVNAQLFLISH